MQQTGKCLSWVEGTGEIQLSDGGTLHIHYSNIVGFPPSVFLRLYPDEEVDVNDIGDWEGEPTAKQVSVRGLKEYRQAVKEMMACLSNFHQADSGYSSVELIRVAREASAQMDRVEALWNVLQQRRRYEQWIRKGTSAYDELGHLAGYKTLEEKYTKQPLQVLNRFELGYKVYTSALAKVLSIITKAKFSAQNVSLGRSSAHNLSAKLNQVLNLEGLEYAREELLGLLLLMVDACRNKISMAHVREGEKEKFSKLLEQIEKELQKIS